MQNLPYYMILALLMLICVVALSLAAYVGIFLPNPSPSQTKAAESALAVGVITGLVSGYVVVAPEL